MKVFRSALIVAFTLPSVAAAQQREELAPLRPDPCTTPQLTATVVKPDEVHLRWTPSSSSRTTQSQMRYFIWQRALPLAAGEAGFSNYLPATLATEAGATGVSVVSLSPGVSYLFAVRAWEGGYNFSDPASVQVDMPAIMIQLAPGLTAVRSAQQVVLLGRLPVGVTYQSSKLSMFSSQMAYQGGWNVSPSYNATTRELNGSATIGSIPATGVSFVALQVTVTEGGVARVIQSIPVSVDLTAPSITLLQPVSGATYETRNAYIRFSGTASDPQGLTRVTWENSRGASGACTGTASWDTGELPIIEGETTFTFRAWDAAGSTAHQIRVQRGDQSPPNQIVDLVVAPPPDPSVDGTKLHLRWTAPADAQGLCNQYDLRYSRSPITVANFANATRVTIGAPSTSGSAETVTISGLIPGTLYYVSVKSKDLAHNWSPPSNTAYATTRADATPPDATLATATAIESLTNRTPITVQSSTTTVSAQWSGFSDPESGLKHYRIEIVPEGSAIGPPPGGSTDGEGTGEVILDRTLAPGVFTTSKPFGSWTVSLQTGQSYRVRVWAMNAAAMWSATPALSAPVLIYQGPPPDTSVLSGPAISTNLTTAVFHFGASLDSVTFEYRLDGGGWTSCGASLSLSALAAGPHRVEARASSPAGNSDATPATHAWDIDLTPPTVSFVRTPANPLLDATGVFEFSASESNCTFEVSLDAAPFQRVSNPWTATGLASGSHNVKARAVDPAGNLSALREYSWSVQLVQKILLAGTQTAMKAGDLLRFSVTIPSGKSVGRAALRVRRPDGTTAEILLDLATWLSGGYTLGDLGNAIDVQLILTLSDGSLLTSDPLKYDNTAPAWGTLRVLNPQGVEIFFTNQSSWTVAWSGCSDLESGIVRFDVALTTTVSNPDGTTSVQTLTSTTAAGTATQLALPPLALTNGRVYTAKVTAINGSGMSSSKSAAGVAYDTTPPIASILTKPANPSFSQNAAFTFSANETGCTFESLLPQIDGGTWKSLAGSVTTSYASLYAGTHAVSIRATDRAGNVSSVVSYTWTIDLSLSNFAWADLPLTAAPSARKGHTAVWIGNDLLVWGGVTGEGPPETLTNTGARYSATTGLWTALPLTNAPTARKGHSATIHGEKMYIFGGTDATGAALKTGAIYDPTANAWTAMAQSGTGRSGHIAGVLGGFLIAWDTATATGDRYNLATGAWSVITPSGMTLRKGSAATFMPSLWKGTSWQNERLYVWGGVGLDGTTYPTDGKRYDAATNLWEPTPGTCPIAGRTSAQAAATGWTTADPSAPFAQRLVIWGGKNAAGYRTDGAMFDPATSAWTTMSATGAPAGREEAELVFSGRSVLIWGGRAGTSYLNSGAWFNPSTNLWSNPSHFATLMTGRALHSSTWSGDRLAVWGGRTATGLANNGGVFRVPPPPPPPPTKDPVLEAPVESE